MKIQLDFQIVCLSLLLGTLGLVAVGSATIYQTDGIINPYTIRHSVYLVLALCAFTAILFIPLELFERTHIPIYFVTLVLALIVLLPWIGVVAGGGRRWIDLGVVTLQVSEIARFLIPIYVAGHLARAYEKVQTSTLAAMKLPVWVGLVLLLFFFQPDFGSAVLIGLVVLGMMYLANVRYRDLFILGLIGSVGLLYIGYHRRDRIIAYFDTWTHAQDEGYQLTQSLIGFGRGEFTGVGVGDGIQKLLYLPEPHNDFIFSMIVEETGFLGGALVLCLLMWLVYRCFAIAKRALTLEQRFAGLISYGAGLMLGIQILINAGVAMGALPTKGLTLPFLSFGGNSLIVCAGLLALVCRAYSEIQAVEANQEKLKH